jgi:Domain of unknown function (DUF4145)
MPTIRCPAWVCDHLIVIAPQDYSGPLQCTKCAAALTVSVRNGVVGTVRLHGAEFPSLPGLPDDLASILDQSVACYEAGSAAGSVVLAGLFLEGLLKHIGVKGDTLNHLIKNASDQGIVTVAGYHMASASRLLRNTGAHYSDGLARLTLPEARLTLDMARHVALEIRDAGHLKGGGQ